RRRPSTSSCGPGARAIRSRSRCGAATACASSRCARSTATRSTGRASDDAVKGAADTYAGRGLIADPIHQYILYTRPGAIPGEATGQALIDTSWVQRLRRVRGIQVARVGLLAAEQ